MDSTPSQSPGNCSQRVYTHDMSHPLLLTVSCLQYIVIIANLRVAWPVTLTMPLKVITVSG